jgi:hypothetical protein
VVASLAAVVRPVEPGLSARRPVRAYFRASHDDAKGKYVGMNPRQSLLQWRRSTRCSNGGCVEVAHSGSAYLVRDAKDPQSAVLTFANIEWQAFIAGIQAGELGSS